MKLKAIISKVDKEKVSLDNVLSTVMNRDDSFKIQHFVDSINGILNASYCTNKEDIESAEKDITNEFGRRLYMEADLQDPAQLYNILTQNGYSIVASKLIDETNFKENRQ